MELLLCLLSLSGAKCSSQAGSFIHFILERFHPHSFSFVLRWWQSTRKEKDPFFFFFYSSCSLVVSFVVVADDDDLFLFSSLSRAQ